MTIETAPVPHRDYDGYRSSILEALEQPPSQWTFKSDRRYRQILEHVTNHQAIAFLTYARQEFPDVWDGVVEVLPGIVADNDRLGQPNKSLTLFGGCSPSNMRYLYHALLVLRHIEQTGQSAVHIVELGGGYGGLALYVQQLAHLFRTQIASYAIVDVPEACSLQATIAEWLGLPLRVANGLDGWSMMRALMPADGVQRFFVSAYGFAEFRAEFQQWYSERLIQYCGHGFLVWNYDTYWDNPVYPFTDKPLHIEPERPLTAPGNSFVSF